jgi:hypothetical protein
MSGDPFPRRHSRRRGSRIQRKGARTQRLPGRDIAAVDRADGAVVSSVHKYAPGMQGNVCAEVRNRTCSLARGDGERRYSHSKWQSSMPNRAPIRSDQGDTMLHSAVSLIPALVLLAPASAHAYHFGQRGSRGHAQPVAVELTPGGGAVRFSNAGDGVVTLTLYDLLGNGVLEFNARTQGREGATAGLPRRSPAARPTGSESAPRQGEVILCSNTGVALRRGLLARPRDAVSTHPC